MSTHASALDMFYGNLCVGTVFDTTPLTFQYSQSWLNHLDAFAVSTIALQSGRIDSRAVHAFFENLLPEGALRVALSAQRKASTLFSLLREVAGDTAGAFVLVAKGELPQPAQYRATSWTDLAEALKRSSAAAIQSQSNSMRISLAGAQDKASIAIFEGNTPMLPLGAAPSTHILKPNIRNLPGIRESAANESIIMRTAAHCGLETAKVFYEPLTQSCVVERFDRFKQADGTLGRLVQYDFCQMADTTSGGKYEKEGGPGIAQCALIIRKYSSDPGLDLRAFAQWIFFNLYVGNNDSHAKNLSIYRRNTGEIRLTPFYDLMSTRAYPGLSNEFAFSLGGEVLPGNIGRPQVEALADHIGMGSKYLQSLGLALAEKIPMALEKAQREISPSLSQNAHTFSQKLAMKVNSTTRSVATRIRS